MPRTASPGLSAEGSVPVSFKEQTASAFMEKIHKLALQLPTYVAALVKERGDQDAAILHFLESVALVADDSTVVIGPWKPYETEPALAPPSVSLIAASVPSPMNGRRKLNEYSIEGGVLKPPFILTFASDRNEPQLTQTIMLARNRIISICEGKPSEEEIDDLHNGVSKTTAVSATGQGQHIRWNYDPVDPQDGASGTSTPHSTHQLPHIKEEPTEIPFALYLPNVGVDASTSVDCAPPFLSSSLEIKEETIDFTALVEPLDDDARRPPMCRCQANPGSIGDTQPELSPKGHRSKGPRLPAVSSPWSPPSAVETSASDPTACCGTETMMRPQVKFEIEGRIISKRTRDQSDDSGDISEGDFSDEDCRPAKRVRTPTPAPESMRPRGPPSTPNALRARRELSCSPSPTAENPERSASSPPTRVPRRSARIVRSSTAPAA